MAEEADRRGGEGKSYCVSRTVMGNECGPWSWTKQQSVEGKVPCKRRHCGWHTADHNRSRPSAPAPSAGRHTLDHHTQKSPLLCPLVTKRMETKDRCPLMKRNSMSYECMNQITYTAYPFHIYLWTEKLRINNTNNSSNLF